MEKLQIGIVADYNSRTMLQLVISEIAKKGYEVNNIIFLKTYKNKIMQLIAKIPVIRLDEIIKNCKIILGGGYKSDLNQIRKQYEEAGIKISDILFKKNIKIHTKCKKEYIVAKSINDEKVYEKIRKSNIKNYIYVASSLIKKETLNLGVNFILVHPGDLPKIRGNSPMIWSQLYEKKYTWTAIYIDEGVDTGDIIAKLSEKITTVNIQNTKENRKNLAIFIQNCYNFQKKAELIAIVCEKLYNNNYKYIGQKQNENEKSRQFFKANEEIVEYAMKKLIKNN